MLKRLFALACGAILLPLSNALGADDFDVLVMRGSALVRVIGDENGPTSEVTIRVAPAPPAPEPVWDRPDLPTEPVKLVIQIFRDDPMPAFGRGFGHGHPFFARNDKPHHGSTRSLARARRKPHGLFRHGSRWPAPGALIDAVKGRSLDVRIRRPIASTWGAR